MDRASTDITAVCSFQGMRPVVSVWRTRTDGLIFADLSVHHR